MKNLILFCCLLIVSASVLSQTTKPKTTPKPATQKPAVKPAAPTVTLRNLNDSASYTIGISIAMNSKQQGINKLNPTLISKACNDVLDNKPALLTEYSANDVLNKFVVYCKEGKIKTPATAAKPTASRPLTTLADSGSYAIGIRYASFYKQYGILKLNTALIAKGCSDMMANKPTLIPETLTNAIMNKFVISVQEELVKPTVDAGKAFLTENAKRSEVKTTPSGLQYEVITEGQGIHPDANDSVTCDYRGTFIDGTVFDESYKRGAPITFSLGGVIAGWTEGLQLMTPGSKYKFYVPHNLAYGPFDRPGIPGGSMLIFEVVLISVKQN
jgi:FKBP-type peptidyl-prolyl cis-trans isomerase